MHSMGATITIKHNEDIMEIGRHHLPHREDISQSAPNIADIDIRWSLEQPRTAAEYIRLCTS